MAAEPFQGQAKGVEGSGLMKPGFRSNSTVFSLKEFDFKKLRPR